MFSTHRSDPESKLSNEHMSSVAVANCQFGESWREGSIFIESMKKERQEAEQPSNTRSGSNKTQAWLLQILDEGFASLFRIFEGCGWWGTLSRSRTFSWRHWIWTFAPSGVRQQSTKNRNLKRHKLGKNNWLWLHTPKLSIYLDWRLLGSTYPCFKQYYGRVHTSRPDKEIIWDPKNPTSMYG